MKQWKLKKWGGRGADEKKAKEIKYKESYLTSDGSAVKYRKKQMKNKNINKVKVLRERSTNAKFKDTLAIKERINSNLTSSP